MKTQHEAALEVAETIRAFREEFPFDADRLLVQYADLQSTRSNDEVIEELREETYRLTQKVGMYDADLDMAKSRIEELEGELRDAHTRIQTLEMEAAE